MPGSDILDGMQHQTATRYYRKIIRKDVCCYCSEKIPKAEYTTEHIFPDCQGGDRNWGNIAAACAICNVAKGDQSLLEFLLNDKRIASNVHRVPLQRSENLVSMRQLSYLSPDGDWYNPLGL